MKANRKSIMDNNGAVNVAMVGMIVALLLTIVVCVLVYFQFTESVTQFDAITERFTGYTNATANASAWRVTLENSPVNSANTNVTCIDNGWVGPKTGRPHMSYPTFSLNHRLIDVGADAANGFTQVNVTYTGNAASAEATSVTPMASTIFSLAPIIALVVVAAILLGIILGGFGSRRRGL